MDTQISNSPTFFEVATAPGDLPMPEVMTRHAVQANQFRHDNTTRPLAPRPGEPIEVRATSGLGMVVDRATIRYTTDGSRPDEHAATIEMTLAEVIWDPIAGYLKCWRGELPGQPAATTVRYQIVGWGRGAGATDPATVCYAHDGQGFWFRHPGTTGITTFALRIEARQTLQPAWMQDAVIYHIFLDRFHPGTEDGRFPPHLSPTDKHGGTFKGVQQVLPSLAALGVNCLWLSPIGVSDSYHRYDATDYFQVDPLLGSTDDLRELTEHAHRLGMRVLLDFVPSHCSWHHPAFVAAQADPDAPTREWFTFDAWPHQYRHFLGMAPFLVSLNCESPGVREHLIASARYWMERCGIDGFRLDHAIAPSMDFWVAFRTALEAINPEVVLIGEVTDTPDALRRYRGRLHDVLDFPLARALRLTFGTGDWHVGELHSFLESYDAFMADGPGRVSFLDNHDMNRFLFVAGNDVARLKLAALCQFTLPLTPVIYYGTEIGLSQALDIAAAGFGGDAEVRRDMVWERAQWDQGVYHFYSQLIQQRRAEPALVSGQRTLLHLDETGNSYAYCCSREGRAAPAAGDAVVCFNLGATTQEITLPSGPGTRYKIALPTSEGSALLREAADGVTVILEPGSGVLVRCDAEGGPNASV